LKKLKKRTVRN